MGDAGTTMSSAEMLARAAGSDLRLAKDPISERTSSIRLDTLPYDILLAIASLLPDYASVNSLSRVSSAFTHPAQAALFRYTRPLDPRRTLSAFLAIQRKPHLARVVKTLRLYVCEADELAGVFRLFPAAWLRLVWRTIRMMTSLQQLEFTAEERKSLPKGLPQLWDLRNLERCNLQLKSCKLRLPAAQPIPFLRQQTSIEELSLHMLTDGGKQLHTEACAALDTITGDLDVLPNLKAIHAPLWVAERLLGERRIEKLYVKDFLIHPDEIVLLSRPQAAYLKYLNVAYLALRPQVLIWIGENLPALEELRVTVLLHPAQCLMETLTSPAVLAALSKLQHLRSLHVILLNCHLHHRETNYDAQVEDLGQKCKSLKEVELCWGAGTPTVWTREKKTGWGIVGARKGERARWDCCWPDAAF